MKKKTKKTKILVIEDDVDLVEMMKTRLEAEKYAVSIAYNGDDGLKLIKKEIPDVIILDLILPNVDGMNVLVELKRSKKTEDIPVIILTGRTEQPERDLSLRLGAYEYITKPYDGYRLVRQIKKVLDKKKKRGYIKERITTNRKRNYVQKKVCRYIFSTIFCNSCIL